MKNESGITLVALVVTVVIIIILSSVGINSGVSTLRSSKYNAFVSELKIMQTEVNELYQEKKYELGDELTDTDTRKETLNAEEISTYISDDIKSSFRYFSKEYIANTLKLEGISRDYLINVQARKVVASQPFNYEGKAYYMIDQVDNGYYNVEYNNQNPTTGNFSVNVSRDGNKFKIDVTDINYEGYVGNWKVKYQLKDSEEWNTSNDLTFYISQPGIYNIKVVHDNEIDLGTNMVVLQESYNYNKDVNIPELLTGMTSIKFTDPTEDTEGTTVKTTYKDENWYDYVAKKWANTQTEDGSMWVWIPRYAYKITYYTDENKTTKSTTKTQYGSVDVKFLIGPTDYYYDENGKVQTAKRQKKVDETIDTTTGYTVHPAFTNESSINFANGGWDKELTGIWVAKFEAGYASGNNSTTVKESSVNYTQSNAWVSNAEAGTSNANGGATLDARNWLDGIYGSNTTSIKYPTFQGLTYSMNYINHNDAYNISKALTEKDNIYGLSSSNADSHLMKNSEWGAVAYLSQSQYGLNGENIYINNVNLNSGDEKRTETAGKSGVDSVYAVTGCCAKTTADDSSETTTIEEINNRTANVYTWTQKNGQKASSTGTIYGIYDLSGGLWERTTGIVSNGHNYLYKYGKSIIDETKITYTISEDGTTATVGENTGTSTKYVTIYPNNDVTDVDTASKNNYAANTKIYGDAIRETSTAGIGQTSWYSDNSYFVGYYNPFFLCGGSLWNKSGAGLFYFSRYDGFSNYGNGFRPVLIAK